MTYNTSTTQLPSECHRQLPTIFIVNDTKLLTLCIHFAVCKNIPSISLVYSDYVEAEKTCFQVAGGVSVLSR